MREKVYMTGTLQEVERNALGDGAYVHLSNVKMGDVDFKDIHESKVTIIAEVRPKIIAPSDAEWLEGRGGTMYLIIGEKLIAIVGAGGSWKTWEPGDRWLPSESQKHGMQAVREYLARCEMAGYSYES